MRDLSKLPKWARDEIESLRRDRDAWKSRAQDVASHAGETDTCVVDHVGATRLERGLPPHSIIGFRLGGGERDAVQVSVPYRNFDGEAPHLLIMGNGSIVIEPGASNLIRVRVTR